jgi:nicotinamidase-related amidase
MQPRMGEFTEEWVLRKARRLYVEASARMDIEPGHTALLVIDMIDEFVKPRWSPYWVPAATRAVPRIKAVLEAFHDAGWPVIYLAYELGQRGLNFPTTDRLVPTTLDVQGYAEFLWKSVSIYGPLAPGQDDLVVLKHCYSGFQGTELEFVLRNLDVSTVVVAGTMTNFCCGATAREAYWRGFKVVFGSDITATDDDDLHEAELRTLRRGYARIMTSAEIIERVIRAGVAAAD